MCSRTPSGRASKLPPLLSAGGAALLLLSPGCILSNRRPTSNMLEQESISRCESCKPTGGRGGFDAWPPRLTATAAMPATAPGYPHRVPGHWRFPQSSKPNPMPVRPATARSRRQAHRRARRPPLSEGPREDDAMRCCQRTLVNQR